MFLRKFTDQSQFGKRIAVDALFIVDDDLINAGNRLQNLPDARHGQTTDLCLRIRRLERLEDRRRKDHVPHPVDIDDKDLVHDRAFGIVVLYSVSAFSTITSAE